MKERGGLGGKGEKKGWKTDWLKKKNKQNDLKRDKIFAHEAKENPKYNIYHILTSVLFPVRMLHLSKCFESARHAANLVLWFMNE